MPERAALLAPRHWLTWLAMGLGWLLAQLPHRAQMWLGARIGALGYLVSPARRHVADVNLKLCFPELDEHARKTLLRAHFRSAGQGAMETLLCWWAADARIEKLTDLQDLEALRPTISECIATGRGMILLSGHFTSLELGVRMAQIYLKRMGLVTTAMYKAPHNPVLDAVMRRARERHIGEPSIPKDNVRGLLKALKRGRAVWYAADQKATNKFSAVVPFFGNPAHTNLATGRLAAMSGAVVVPFFTLRREDGRGYRLLVQPPLSDVPSGDDKRDAERLNRLIEDMVRTAPAQYFWLHQRFKGPATGDPYLRAGDGGGG